MTRSAINKLPSLRKLAVRKLGLRLAGCLRAPVAEVAEVAEVAGLRAPVAGCH